MAYKSRAKRLSEAVSPIQDLADKLNEIATEVENKEKSVQDAAKEVSDLWFRRSVSLW